MQHGEVWAPVASSLAPRYRTALIDFGEPTLAASASAIAAAGRGGVVVAYSMGGRLALHAAVAEPGAFRALVLVGATPGLEDERRRAERRAADERLAAWIEGEPIEQVVDFWERQPVFATQSPELVRDQRPGRLGHDPTTLARMLRATGQGTLAPLWDRLAQIDIPVLAVAGERDARYAAEAERMAGLLPEGRAAIVAGAGHAPQLERPDAFAELLGAFLDDHLG